jgi:hypothetical protein
MEVQTWGVAMDDKPFSGGLIIFEKLTGGARTTWRKTMAGHPGDLVDVIAIW